MEDDLALSTIQPSPPDSVSPPISDVVGASALRKASLRLIPLIALGYVASYVDRINVSFASLQMNRDLHFTASIYGFGAGLFFLGYALCEIPSNLLLYRFGARRWIARIMFTWGLLAIGMMFIKIPVHFYIMRFLLGVAEAGFAPGVIFYLTQWFPAATRARMISRYWVALPLGSMVMGVLAGALLNLNGRLGLAGWQWLFLIEGLPPVLLTFAFLAYLPDNPAEARWLTASERTWLMRQLEAESPQGRPGDNDIKRALLDPRVWQLAFLHFCMLTCSYSYSLSAPAILQKVTGFSITNVGFLTASISLLTLLSLLLNARHSDRKMERYWHLAIPCLLMAFGFLVSGLSTNPWLVVPALALVTISFFSTPGPFWALASNFHKGRPGATGIAAISAVATLGGFIGPYWMGLAKDLTGSYQRGLLTLTVPALVAAFMLFVMRHGAAEQKMIRAHP
jgi:ACS family tartrate transporter-like MFS transporter